MTNKFSLRQFKRKYGTHQMCLEAIKDLRYPDGTQCPKCKESSVFYPVTDRTAYACKFCGWHVYPLAGTVFEKSTTPLDLWFFAMYLMVQTRAGISAKQLERMLGVTYKTAWRMFKQIRILMAEDGGGMLNGIVEIDETFGGYYHLPKFGYYHESVNHQLEIVRGEVHTQNIENFWSHFKRGITGVYRVVSKKYLQAYVDEYGFRYNHRNEPMFELLLGQISGVKTLEAL